MRRETELKGSAGVRVEGRGVRQWEKREGQSEKRWRDRGREGDGK